MGYSVGEWGKEIRNVYCCLGVYVVIRLLFLQTSHIQGTQGSCTRHYTSNTSEVFCFDRIMAAHEQDCGLEKGRKCEMRGDCNTSFDGVFDLTDWWHQMEHRCLIVFDGLHKGFWFECGQRDDLRAQRQFGYHEHSQPVDVEEWQDAERNLLTIGRSFPKQWPFAQFHVELLAIDADVVVAQHNTFR